MHSFLLLVAVVALTVHSTLGFQNLQSKWKLPTARRAAASDFIQNGMSLLTAIESKPDDYVYGAVSAPDWVLPAAAVLAILTAAIPILLRPGEKALEEQRNNESITNNKFNKKRDV
jgi:hypothetical protein